jgi:hypothetical protein
MRGQNAQADLWHGPCKSSPVYAGNGAGGMEVTLCRLKERPDVTGGKPLYVGYQQSRIRLHG